MMSVRFSPTNLDHAIAPFGRVGSEFNDAAGYVTFDGSNSWLPGRGPPTGWLTNEVAIGPDGQTVWLLASTGSYGAPILSAMYVSYDGGLNYQEAFAASEENPFVATNPLGDPIPHAQIESALGHPIFHTFPSDYKTVSTALNSGVPLALSGNTEISSQFDSFARRILDPNASAPESSAGKRGPLPLGLQRLASIW